MNAHIKSSEYAWHHTQLKLAGRILIGIINWEFSTKVDTEELYGAGQDAFHIQKGNKHRTGKITVYGFELDRLEQAAQAAGFDSIIDVPHELLSIVITARKLAKDPITSIVATGVSFTKTTDAMSQGASKRECELPVICMDIQKKTITL